MHLRSWGITISSRGVLAGSGGSGWGTAGALLGRDCGATGPFLGRCQGAGFQLARWGVQRVEGIVGGRFWGRSMNHLFNRPDSFTRSPLPTHILGDALGVPWISLGVTRGVLFWRTLAGALADPWAAPGDL